ncbi:protein IQ-DOMAIN 2-like isoform X2 [Rhodamnia argentea]|uniref:Protein IQ-DOMAIN 2-like isoform X2 n=1 Tax=Rhodamnia argentea TaxID=178133 RepID=A0ABM3GSC3_9MYRT|nr:protein IQ-DOMAIN 2-like isoform X2 [Rhodamnia argentea]
MGKGNWFSSVKKALSPDSKEKREPKSSTSKKKWFGKQKDLVSDLSLPATVAEPLPPPLPPQTEEVNLTDEAKEESRHVHAIAIDANSSSNTAAEAVKPTYFVQFAGKSKEEAAAIKIQKSFRGYQARRAMRALRGLVRLKSLVEGPAVKRQVVSTLKCMQTLARVQSQIHSRRIRMSEENQALQKQLLQKRAKELENLRLGEEWDHSLQSKEQIESKLLKKFEAAMRRERALAYSFTHQTWKNPSKLTNHMFLDPNNPTWGWSWLERWMAARPWEGRSTTEKEPSNNLKSAFPSIAGGEVTTSYARFQLNLDKQSPTASQTNGFQSPSTPKPASSVASRRLKPATPKSSARVADDDSESMVSMQSGMNRRHSIGGLSVRDDESLGSSASVPSYMVATESARAKSRLQSPLGIENNGTPDKGTAGTAKKRLSFAPSPARPRRYSGPPKLNSSIVSENSVTNGGAS